MDITYQSGAFCGPGAACPPPAAGYNGAAGQQPAAPGEDRIMATPLIAFAQLANEIEKEGLNPKNGERVAHEIAKAFGVKEDEVGILRLERQMLSFIFPGKLATVGSIPVNTSTSVAARTANTKRADVSEALELANKPKVVGQHVNPEDKLAHVIQKMMSVPVLGPAGVVGV